MTVINWNECDAETFLNVHLWTDLQETLEPKIVWIGIYAVGIHHMNSGDKLKNHFFSIHAAFGLPMGDHILTESNENYFHASGF